MTIKKFKVWFRNPDASLSYIGTVESTPDLYFIMKAVRAWYPDLKFNSGELDHNSVVLSSAKRQHKHSLAKKPASNKRAVDY